MVGAGLEKWVWLDLLGFDMARADCAAPALFEQAGFVPPVVSLLLHNAEFVHLHRGVSDERPFPADVCSYGGHPRNEDRERQPWTPSALHRLVRVLQSLGSEVIFSLFDSGSAAGWREHHPELGYVLRDGTRHTRLCPWKRFSDGAYYEAFFAQRLRQVIGDYGFDGFHGADGWSHPRFPLHEADFSDDMIGQFMGAVGRDSIPDWLVRPADQCPEAIARRAAWVWAHRRREWIAFHIRRTTRFWAQVADAVHESGGRLVLNSCWTRDPFEAAYRYGVDYVSLTEAGADAFVVEAAGAVQELGGDLPYGTAYGRSWTDWDPSRILCRFQTTLMQIKGAVPDTQLVFLNGIKDTNEIWNGLRHAPTNVESEITMHGNVFLRVPGGAYSRCASGPMVCLADGIRAHEWQWLNRVWERSFCWPVQRVLGVEAVWPANAGSGQVSSYLSSRRRPFGRLLFDMVRHGAPVYSIVPASRLVPSRTALLIIYPDLFSKAELDAVFAAARGSLFVVGGTVEFPVASPSLQVRDPVSGLWLTVYQADAGVRVPAPGDMVGEAGKPVPDKEPPSWIYELPAEPVGTDFLRTCADAIALGTGAPRVVENGDSVRVWAAADPGGTVRLFVRNDSFYYRLAEIDVQRTIGELRVRTEFPGSPIPFEGSRFHVKVPGKGVVIADMTCE